MSRNFTILLRWYNVTIKDLTLMNKQMLKNIVRRKHENNDWRISILKELLLCQVGLLQCNFSSEELSATIFASLSLFVNTLFLFFNQFYLSFVEIAMKM